MLIKDQLIELKWNNSTRKVYEGEKYKYTFEKDVFIVHLDDLTVNSGSKVKIKCDLCGETYARVYANYIRSARKTLNKQTDDICDNCLTYLKQNKVECFKLIIDKKLKMAPKGTSGTFSDDEVREIIEYLTEYLLNKKIISNIEDMKKFISQKNMSFHGLGSIMGTYTINRVKQLLFPELMEWEFGGTSRGFWKNEKNWVLVKDWLRMQLEHKYNVKEPTEILNLDLTSIIKDSGLITMFYQCFNANSFKFWNYIYPNTFVEMQFCVSNHFYDDDSNKILAIDWLISELLRLKRIISIDDLPTYLTFEIFSEFGLSQLIVHHFNCRPHECLSFRFPNKWSNEDFKIIVANDGTVVDSKAEMKLHNFMLDNLKSVDFKYNGSKKKHTTKFFNDKYNETYIPDWIIDGKIIVEYFGLYNNYNNQGIFQYYTEKTHRKIEFYKTLQDYSLVSIYPNELNNDLKIAKSKILSSVGNKEASVIKEVC